MNTLARAADDLAGTHRTFGAEGPVYCVLTQRDNKVRVRVVATGEELDYPVAQAINDPQAR